MTKWRRGELIVIADYDPGWPAKFDHERDLIIRTCGDVFAGFEHVGSTSVPGLAAKPIIDIMPGLRSLDEAAPLIPLLESIGYEYVPEFELPNEFDEGLPLRRYFRKDEDGRRAYHVHMVEVGSDFWREHLLFRNYLRAHPEAAAAYARLKREIAQDFNANLTPESDVNRGYTDRKSGFIEATKAKAHAEATGSV